MRKLSSLLTAAAVVAGVTFTATPASADSYCFGAPSEPLTYVCIIVTGPTEPVIGYTTTYVTVPSVCYGVGCTETTTIPVTYPTVTTFPSPGSVDVYWAGSEDLSYLLERVYERVFPICLTKPDVCVVG